MDFVLPPLEVRDVTVHFRADGIEARTTGDWDEGDSIGVTLVDMKGLDAPVLGIRQGLEPF